MKIKLVLRPDEFTSFTSYYLEEFWRKYFDVEFYDSKKSYSQKNTAFVVWWMHAGTDWVKQMRERGYCIVVDNLWELGTGRKDGYWLENHNWFWYNESLWWTALNYNNFHPMPSSKLLAFMPVRKQTPARDRIIKYLNPLLTSMLWSYHNRSLPNDTTDSESGQRYYHPDWYNSTYSSLVIETHQQGPMFITEKTFKPMAFYHPFQILGVPGTLKRLQELGFETFDNLFDESYDNIQDIETRCKKVIDNLQQIKTMSYDALTNEKLQHNHDRFFNTDMVKQRMVTEIINPLIEYVQQSS